MSLLNFTARAELENQHQHRNAKQFGVSEVPRSTVKKTALTDVKNILAQRTVHSAKKLPTSAAKSNIPKKNLFGIFNDKENEVTRKETKKPEFEFSKMKEVDSTSNSVLTTETNNDSADSVFVEPVCSFCDTVEDDYADILLKNITLTKSQIETLATEWERPPIVSEKDMRTIEVLGPVPDMRVSFSDWPVLCDQEQYELEFNLLDDIPAVELVFED